MTRFKLSKAYSVRGADMGRPDAHGEEDVEYIFRLQRVRLDAGAYDSGGAYWGFPNNLYRAESDGGDVIEHLRADDREDAKEQVMKMYPRARFYR